MRRAGAPMFIVLSSFRPAGTNAQEAAHGVRRGVAYIRLLRSRGSADEEQVLAVGKKEITGFPEAAEILREDPGWFERP